MQGPNLDCFVHRVGAHPERLQNIYFTYALVVRAINKLGPYLEKYPFCTSNDIEDDKEIKVREPPAYFPNSADASKSHSSSI